MEREATDRPLSGSIELGRGCYVCGPDNASGLQLDFHQRASSIEAPFTFAEEFSGAPTYVHGGIIMAVLDDAMAWAAIAIHEKFSVTASFESRFLRPVRTGQPHIVSATTEPMGSDGLTMSMTGQVVRSDGRVCAEATGVYRAIADM